MTEFESNEVNSEPENSPARVDVLEKKNSPRPKRLIQSKEKQRRRIFFDKLSSKVVTLGGVAIIFSILAIFFVIFSGVLPLFYNPKLDAFAQSENLSESGLFSQIDEYRELAFTIHSDGKITRYSFPDKQSLTPLSITKLSDSKILTLEQANQTRFFAGTNDGRVIPFHIQFSVQYEGGQRKSQLSLEEEEALVLDPLRKPIRRLVSANTDSGSLYVAQTEERHLILYGSQESRSLMGEGTREEFRSDLQIQTQGEIRSLLLDDRGESLLVGSSLGELLYFDLSEKKKAQWKETSLATSSNGTAITVMHYLIGDRRWIVGDAAGGLSAWQLVNQPGGGGKKLQKIYDFDSHSSAVSEVASSTRDKSFLSIDRQGVIQLHYGTTGQTLLRRETKILEARSLAFAPKADACLIQDREGKLSLWNIDNAHPETSVKSIFGKVWYEGYDQPEYVWQSTGGTDDFEAKFSLTPLIYGTLKGTLYALLFAVPIALLAALYVSQFMHPQLRALIKPSVEVMAALPSVVLGFLAGLWIAPHVEKVVPGLFLTPLIFPICILSALWIWQRIPKHRRNQFRPGMELCFLIPAVFIGTWISFALGGMVEAHWMNGDYRAWLFENFGWSYDQRNSLVVGFAMGFAVIPIIFTIAEDSLSNVPQHLSAASLALGATRWQTALRVVLPTGSPGIFSAIMIGFGRAVGETMIVLMSTGNTPVMDLSIFNGFRALSANIAVELPEAPHGATLYRVLFLAALLLFILTFVVNTAAELVRLRLREKYRYL